MSGGDVAGDRFSAGLSEPLAFEVDDLVVEVDVLDAGDLGGGAVSQLDLHDNSSSLRSARRLRPLDHHFAILRQNPLRSTNSFLMARRVPIVDLAGLGR